MVLFAVRHAERQPDPFDGQSSAGSVRAWRLAHMLSESGVSVGYCSDACEPSRHLRHLSRCLATPCSFTKCRQEDEAGLKPISKRSQPRCDHFWKERWWWWSSAKATRSVR